LTECFNCGEKPCECWKSEKEERDKELKKLPYRIDEILSEYSPFKDFSEVKMKNDLQKIYNLIHINYDLLFKRFKGESSEDFKI
jgi:hypothetical protein